MKKCKVFFLPLARQDVKEIKVYYRKISPRLVKRFTAEFFLFVEKIEDWPEYAAVRYDSTRCANLKKFPYAIHYYYDKSTNAAYISGVYHNASDPNKGPLRSAE